MATGLSVPWAQNNAQRTQEGLQALEQLARQMQEGAGYADQATMRPSLAAHIRKHWRLARDAKQSVETEMLRAVRARRGEYDPQVLARLREQGGSQIYMRVFATKARQLKAVVTDVLIGTGASKPWTVSPTPMPALPPQDAQAILQQAFEEATQAEAAGLPMTVEDIRQSLADAKNLAMQRVQEQAREEAERAEMAIEDALVEGGYLDALDAFVDDLTTFKTAFLKGPIVRRANTLQWAQQPDGTTQPVVQEGVKVEFERVDPFMVYPAPWAKGVQDAELIERHRLSRSDLNALRGVSGYDDEAIERVLQRHGEGGLHEWLNIDQQKADAEGREAIHQGSSELIDALQFWGSVSGRMLREWGLDESQVPDESHEYEVEAWLIGDEVIKAVVNPDPMGNRPYFCDGFSRIPGAFWHQSLFDVVSDCADMCNAAARALSNNLGIASGPQAVVNIDRLASGEELGEMYPWKLWQTVNDPMGSSAAPVSFFQPNSNAGELMGVYERFSLIADEVSGIPRYMAGMGGGEGGAGRTASGMQMMIGNASKMVRAILASIDQRVIAPLVERQYQHLMMYNQELNLRGDLQVMARGSLSVAAKEAAQLRLNEFLAATGNPVDMQILGLDGRAELLRQAVKRLDINSDKVVPSASAVKVRAAQAQAQQAQEAAMAQGQPGGPGPAYEGATPHNTPGQSGQRLMGGGPVTGDLFTPQPRPQNVGVPYAA